MAWQGRTRLSRKVGAGVRLGDYLVPKAVTMTGEGERGDPDFRFEFAIRDGEPMCVQATMMIKPGGRSIRTGDLCGFNIDSLTSSAFREFAEPIIDEAAGTVTSIVGGMGEREAWHVRKLVDDEIAKPRGTSEAELREVAAVYLRHPDAPLKAVEMRLGYTRRTAARRVAEARERLLLDTSESSTDPAAPQLTQEQIMEELAKRGPRRGQGD